LKPKSVFVVLVLVATFAVTSWAENQIYPKMDVSKVQLKIDPFRETKNEQTRWDKRPFYIIQTDLSPAWLVHSTMKEIYFFYELDKWGMGYPMGLAIRVKTDWLKL